MNTNILVGLVLIVLGFIVAFYGLKLFKLVIVIVAFIIGLGLGVAVTGLIFPSGDPTYNTLKIIIPIIVGVVFVYLASFFYKLGFAVVIGFALYSFVSSVMSFTTFDPTVKLLTTLLVTLVILVLIIATGIYELPVIVATAFNGSTFITSGLFIIFLNIAADFTINMVLDKTYVLNTLNESNRIIYLGVFLFFFFVSTLSQFIRRGNTVTVSHS